MSDFIFLIVGPSGSGKTTLCDQLRVLSKLQVLESYTTRKPRYEGERGHVFVRSLEDCKDTIVAYTVFDGHEYWATQQQVEDSDLYVIDPEGVAYFRQHYTGKKWIKTILIDAPWQERYRRMRGRGDSIFAALRRLWHDRRVFRGWARQADFVIKNTELAWSFMNLDQYIKRCRRGRRA